MRLKSFGCSFIFGTDLHDDSRYSPKATSSNFTWPAMLAKKHGWDYTCYARPGAGNVEISERLLSQAVDIEPCIYVVGWSWIDRFSYTNDQTLSFKKPDPECHRVMSATWATPWKTIMPVDDNDVSTTYYRHLHSEMADKYMSLMCIKLAIDTLKAKNQPFIMTYMDDLLFDNRWNTTPAITALQGYCEPYMTRFDGKNLLEWSKEKGFEISQTQHPLEAAHEAAAELIHSYNLV